MHNLHCEDSFERAQSAHDGNDDFDSLLDNELAIRKLTGNQVFDFSEGQSDLLHFSAGSGSISRKTRQYQQALN